jgi:hypothetical protein
LKLATKAKTFGGKKFETIHDAERDNCYTNCCRGCVVRFAEALHRDDSIRSDDFAFVNSHVRRASPSWERHALTLCARNQASLHRLESAEGEPRRVEGQATAGLEQYARFAGYYDDVHANCRVRDPELTVT